MKISLFVFVFVFVLCVCVCVFVEIVYTTFKSNNHRDNKQPVFIVIKSDFFFFFESCFSSQSTQALINVISYKQRPITMLHAIQRIIPIKYKFCTKETNKIVQIN